MNQITIQGEETITKVADALRANNFEPIIVADKEEALAKIKELIPAGVSVMNGSSTTLQQIGFIEYLKSGTHGWNNLHETILLEKDPIKQAELRKHAVVSDYYLGSVHAVTEKGELIISSNSGSQLPHLVYTSQNLVLVVGAQKIVPDLTEGFERLENNVVPLEDIRMQAAYGYGTMRAKTLILHKENPVMGRKIQVLLVKESLGF